LVSFWILTSFLEKYDVTTDKDLLSNIENAESETTREWYEKAGQSRRIWNELYKVIDSSDVIIHVLDARDPNGTRCRAVEKFLKKEASHKHMIFVLNKCDLVPSWCTVSFNCLFGSFTLYQFHKKSGLWLFDAICQLHLW
jgi:nuclear GTP-binding protein